MQFDHLMHWVPDLDAATQAYQALGFTIQPGGEHPGVGTRNAAWRIDARYIELITVHDEGVARAGFGPAWPAIQASLGAGGGGLAFAVLVSDVDLAAGRVTPRKPRVEVNYKVHVSEPKTAKGKRSLALDPATAAALREHRAHQAEERLIVGPGWQDSGLVFTWGDGRPLHPERFSRWFERLAREAGLPKIRLHDVRHSYATAALAAGVPAKVVSERLGHANIAITMDTYSHVLPGMDERAASVVARLILDDEPPGEAAR